MSESESNTKPLKYNVKWIEHNFTTRAAREALLAPERETGNVSVKDYETAVQFSPAWYSYNRYIGAICAVPLTFIFRKPSWGQGRQLAFLTMSMIGGSYAGHAHSISGHLQFIRSLEDPSGFGQALENIQRNSGMPVPRGPVIIRAAPNKWAVGLDEGLTPTDTPPDLPTSTIPAAPVDNSKPSISPTSKWDQIRAVNSRTSTNSSWDALRQNHERTRVPPSIGSGDASGAFQRSRTEDRAAEQAKFDELLEKERNIK